MSPYQIGFLAARLMSVVCAVMAGRALAYAIALVQGLPGNEMPPSYFLSAVTPFAVDVLLAVGLWVWASTFASVFREKSIESDREATSEDWTTGLLRAVGAYFVVESAGPLVQGIWVAWADARQDPEGQLLNPFWDYFMKPVRIEELVSLLCGLVLLIGARRIWRGISGGASKFWKSTSLPSEE
ncbi:MAG: hypothetical protein HZC36_16895 [Armatimonadetes bacterium]|nr:hypothetical protein [Armatimonadota bacterium]